jgi:hypothetical protein
MKEFMQTDYPIPPALSTKAATAGTQDPNLVEKRMRNDNRRLLKDSAKTAESVRAAVQQGESKFLRRHCGAD